MLKTVLSDDEILDHVVNELFNQIDESGDGSLQKEEIQEFVTKICKELGLEDMLPDPEELTRIFNALDTDGDNDISVTELKTFLQSIFTTQRDEMNRMLV
jgi:Ca2+-binding EF-hand superfamily protein